ncbi:MAG: hypothetical protein M1836_002247 [Candelina mexicana]|nr:MAG: hypothetical protein M1836_002247 [Candelina mexicana]
MEGETIGRRARRPIVRLDETVEDGLSLYRSLSRQLNGDPQKYVSILNAVLDHFLRIWIQHDHPRHQEYERFSTRWPHNGPVTTFFGALSCPDLTASAGPRSFKDVLWVIANALNVRLVIWKSIPDRLKNQPIHEIGPMAFPECHVLQRGPEGSSEVDHYDSLLEDESGKTLIEYMHSQKGRSDLEAKEICWYGNGFECYNGYRPLPGKRKPNLSGRTDFLWVIAVSVKEPEKISVAIRMIDEALKRAPAQEMRTAHKAGGRHRPLRRFVSVDAEFKRVRLTEEDLNLELDRANNEREREEIRAGNPEHLCSTLTIAIDRHAVFNFHILNMLENATSTTVQYVGTICFLHQLFQRILFNKQIIKLWFNYQIDIPVLQATIAHMYQGTPRRRHRVDTMVRGEMQSSWKIPTFKIRSPFLNGLRPVDVTFINHDQPCTMHNSLEKSSDDSSEHLRSCPCWSGNIDITALLDSIGRQLRWRTDDPSNPTQPWSEDCLMQLRDWTMPKHGCNYGDFLRWTMEKDRLYPFFEYFKAIPDQLFPRSNNFHDPAQLVYNPSMQERKTAWYDSFGPGMETDDLKMGYAMGDVIGIALLMRFLTTTDDRMLFTARFTNYAVPVKDSSYCTVYPTKSQITSTLTPSSSVPLVDDNPRLWSRRKVGLESLPNRNQYRGWGDKISVDFYRPDQVDTRSMSYFEHEECAKVSRWAYESNYANLISTNSASRYAYHAASATDNQILLEASLQTAHEELFDPLKFQLPDILTAQPPGLTVSSPDQKVIVRAGTTHTEDLINLIHQQRQRRNAHIYAPPGFRAPPGSSAGLPAGINRTPGYELGRDLPPAFDWPRNSRILRPPPPPGSDPPGNLPPGDGSLPDDWRGYDIYDQSGKRYRRDKYTSTGTSQDGGAITQHHQYSSNRPVSAVTPMTRTSYPQELQRHCTQPNPYITPRTSGSYPGNRTTQPFPPNRPLGQFDLLHLRSRGQKGQGETWQRHNRDVSAPPTHFGPPNPSANIDPFRGPSSSSFDSAPITFRPPPAGPSRSAAIPIVAPPPEGRQTLGTMQSRPHPSSQEASSHVDFPLTDSTRDVGVTAKSVDETKRNQSRGGQQGIASGSAKRQDRKKRYWTEWKRETRSDKKKKEAEEMEKMKSIERESATRNGSGDAVDNKVDSSNQHKDTEHHSDNDENEKDHDAGGGDGKGIRKNSVVRFGVVGLGKRKRVGDSDDRIGAVLERVEKMTRSS